MMVLFLLHDHMIMLVLQYDHTIVYFGSTVTQWCCFHSMIA